MSSSRAFTLIELLIVVAIIGILAAIAVPNFLNAQVRAKIARVLADCRAISTSLEAYFIDHNAYVPDMGSANEEVRSYRYLTTPIAYLTSVSVTADPFTAQVGRADQEGVRSYYDYGNGTYHLSTPEQRREGVRIYMQAGTGFIVLSFGPDRSLNFPWSSEGIQALGRKQPLMRQWLFASTNGLNSKGDIITTRGGVINEG